MSVCREQQDPAGQVDEAQDAVHASGKCLGGKELRASRWESGGLVNLSRIKAERRGVQP